MAYLILRGAIRSQGSTFMLNVLAVILKPYFLPKSGTSVQISHLIAWKGSGVLWQVVCQLRVERTHILEHTLVIRVSDSS